MKFKKMSYDDIFPNKKINKKKKNGYLIPPNPGFIGDPEYNVRMFNVMNGEKDPSFVPGKDYLAGDSSSDSSSDTGGADSGAGDGGAAGGGE